MILDVGSSSIKAGLSTESLPSVVFPTVYGVPMKKTGGILRKKVSAEADVALPSQLLGHEALHHINRATLTYPVERAVVTQWAPFEFMAQHCFDELGVSSDSTGVVLPEPPYNPKQCTEQLAQTFFEAFNVPQMAVIPSGICALYASGRTTGVVLDSGAGVTHVTPVYDSFVIPSAINRINQGGDDVTEHLRNLLFERGLNFTSPHDVLQVKRMKESCGYISHDYEAEMKDSDEKLAEFRLPDGQPVQIGKERFRAPEILFRPQILQTELPSMSEFVAAAVKGCGLDLRRALMGSIVLCGGNTLFKGYARRLEEEATTHFPGLFGSVKVLDAPDRLFSVWAGACVVASLPSFKANIVTKDVYEEHGPSIVRGYNKGHVDEEDDLPPPPPE